MHIRNKKNDQARQNQKQMKNPTRNDVPFSAPRQTKMRKENEEPTKDMLDEGKQSVDSNKPSKFDPILQWTMQRVRPTVTNTLGLTNMIGGYY